jgi:motility quorum-sensing regulator/GCU-specific mRNA interferase toxin
MTRPLYDLERVAEAARAGRVVLPRRVQVDYQEIGYALDDVHDCLARLTPADYRGVFERDGIQYDVYHPRYRGPTGHVDELYVKLSERSAAILSQVVLGSFHLQRIG